MTRGNTKLGRKIHHWSLPAIETCPGASEACKAVCYATRGRFDRFGLIKRYRRNERQSRRADFVPRMIAECRGHETIRLHCSGDFYSAAYVRRWIRIAQACPDTLFYGYSRSWRRARILPALQELAALPNVRLWFSCDHETGKPPRTKHVRFAYMSLSDDDVPAFRVHLTFRDKRKTVMKYEPGGSLVCPVEQGVERKQPVTCGACQLCFLKANPPRKANHLLPVLT